MAVTFTSDTELQTEPNKITRETAQGNTLATYIWLRQRCAGLSNCYPSQNTLHADNIPTTPVQKLVKLPLRSQPLRTSLPEAPTHALRGRCCAMRLEKHSLLLYSGLKAILSQYKVVANKTKYKGPISTDCRDRGSQARGVYPTQDTSRMRTARVKQEEEADTRIIVKE